MCETNDGFKISEVDMQLRGPGDILGLRLGRKNILTDFSEGSYDADQKSGKICRNQSITSEPKVIDIFEDAN